MAHHDLNLSKNLQTKSNNHDHDHHDNHANLKNNLDEHINYLKKSVGLDFLNQVNIGLEREGLRINTDGTLNQDAHSKKLGSAMLHPSITTDFAENLLEFVTKPHPSAVKALHELNQVTNFTLGALQNQFIWPSSMPANVLNEKDIPVGFYGNSNSGKMKHLYRKGLSLRYGKMMQAIAGVHYNFSLTDNAMQTLHKAYNSKQSLQDFQSERYLNLVRNVNRFGFIIPYLFGASPVLSKCFFQNKAHNFGELNQDDVGMPYATSLRLSDIGYSNKKCQFFVSSNHIDNYIRDLNKAVTTPCADFTQLGLIQAGEYQQLNDNILQIENEYYTSIRPKQVLQGSERPLCALKKRGIMYVELRSLDIDPLEAAGISLTTMEFVQTFLTMCLILDAQPLGHEESKLCAQNLKNVAQTGRDLTTNIILFDQNLSLQAGLQLVLDLIKPMANILGFQSSFQEAQDKVNNPSLIPSAKLAAQMQSQNKTHQSLMHALALQHAKTYQENPLDQADLTYFNELALSSLKAQENLENEPQIPFTEYLAEYFAKVCDE